MTLADLRTRAFSPCLFADRVRDGVLYDVGLAAWEMPPAATGGGYTQYVRPPYHAEHDALLIPALRGQSATLTTRKRMEELYEAMHILEVGTLVLAELPTVYGRGSSLLLQNCVFAPHRSAEGVDSFHDQRPDVASILATWPADKRLYVHLGVANNALFHTGSLRFNIAYPLRCRGVESNELRFFVEHAAFGVAETSYVDFTSIGCADAVARPLPRCVFDPTHPSVVAMSLAQIAEMVGEFGAQVRYVVHGETGLRLGPHVASPADVLTNEQLLAEPRTPYSAAHTAGFRAYLQEVLGLTIDAVNARWGTAFVSFGEVDPTQPGFFHPGNLVGLRDYFAYHSFLLLELSVQEAVAAKAADPSVTATRLAFGPFGLEHSGLVGDLGACGDWSGETSATYLVERIHPLELVALGARLSGAPCVFAITAPPAILRVNPPGDPLVPPLMRAFRTYTTREVHWLFRDVLTAGAVHVGYLKGPGVAFGQDPGSRTAVLDTIADIVGRHTLQFAAMGSWQRVAIQVDAAGDMLRPDLDSGAGRVAWHLVRRLRDRHTPVALTQSARALVRPLSRWWLSRSLLIVPYHAAIDELRTEYAALFPNAARGAALFVAEPAAPPPWVDATPLLVTPLGSLHRALGPTNVFLFASRAPRDPPDDFFWRDVALAIDLWVRPVVEDHIASSAADPYLTSPVTVLPGAGPAPLGDIVTSSVGDGINWTVAASNLGTGTQTVQLGVAPAIATALGVTYAPQTVSLAAGDTAFVTLEAEGHGVDVTASVTGALVRLGTLAADGYDTGPAAAVLDLAGQLGGEGRSARALAALVAVHRALILRTMLTGNQLRVQVRRVGMLGEAEGSYPVVGAAVILTWPLNAREEAADPTWVTDADGELVLPLPAGPVEQRWDWAGHHLVDPPANAGDVVEIQVTDPATGVSTRATVASA